MPKYLLLKHYRGGPEPHRPFPPMDQWAPRTLATVFSQPFAPAAFKTPRSPTTAWHDDPPDGSRRPCGRALRKCAGAT
jgi:hypothetical protein